MTERLTSVHGVASPSRRAALRALKEIYANRGTSCDTKDLATLAGPSVLVKEDMSRDVAAYRDEWRNVASTGSSASRQCRLDSFVSGYQCCFSQGKRASRLYREAAERSQGHDSGRLQAPSRIDQKVYPDLNQFWGDMAAFLATYVACLNHALAGRPADVTISIHICRGNSLIYALAPNAHMFLSLLETTDSR
jgi:hypothetical protein